MAKKKFSGVIRLDVRDSTPDWAAYLAPKAPEGAPNVLVILYDDTGGVTSPATKARGRHSRSLQSSDYTVVSVREDWAEVFPAPAS